MQKQLLTAAQSCMIREEFYLNKRITEVLFNKNTWIVTLFKEHLIYDDACEFLQQFNTCAEARHIIKVQATFQQAVMADTAMQA